MSVPHATAPGHLRSTRRRQAASYETAAEQVQQACAGYRQGEGRSLIQARLQNFSEQLSVPSYPSVSPCVCENEKKKILTIWILLKFDISVFFGQSVEKIQFSLNSDKNNGYFT